MQQYDVGSVIEFRLKTEDDTCFDLTGAQVKLLWQKPNSPNVEVKDMTIDNASQGVCSYVIQDGDLDASGTHKLQVVVITQNYQLYSNVIQIKVEASLTKYE